MESTSDSIIKLLKKNATEKLMRIGIKQSADREVIVGLPFSQLFRFRFDIC